MPQCPGNLKLLLKIRNTVAFFQLDCKKDHRKKTGRNAEGVSRAEVF